MAPLLCIFAVSFALLVDEIMLSAIFHVLLGAGNTVSAIGVALVGFSASGVVAYALPGFHRRERAGRLAAGLLLAFSVSLLVTPLLLMRIPVTHGDLLHGAGVTFQVWRLVVLHVAVVPFFLGGLTIALLLRAHPERVSRLYFADLGGAALGCLASPLLLTTLGAPSAVAWGAAPAVLLALGLGRRTALPRGLLLGFAVLAAGLLFTGPGTFARLGTMGTVRDPAYRSFAIDEEDIDYEKWALDAWTIIRGPDIPQQWERFEGWGLSRSYRGPVPETRLINYNARFSTYVTRLEGGVEGGIASIAAWLDADLGALHHQIGRRYESVLNIGAGGGREVLSALQHGAQRVVAVDVSDVVVEDLMKGELLDWSGGLYADPRVTAVAAEGRTFTERSRERFDLIDFSIVGGVNLEKMDLVRVDDLFTREALRTYVSRLSPEGVLSYVMYTTRSDLVAEMAARNDLDARPYIPALRTLTGLRLALTDLRPGIRFPEHVLIAALPGVIHPRYDLVHIVVGASPFTGAERQAFLERCRTLAFPVLYPSQDANPYARVIEAPDREGLERLARALPFSIWPPSDDRPFQYALDGHHLARALREGTLFGLLAANPLVSAGASIGLLALLVVLLPLFAARAGAPRGGILLLYFACIGFGYMAVEIAALLRIQSYLGKPIYGLSVALFAFLLSSGLGSFATGAISQARLSRAAGAIVACVVVAGLGFLWLSEPLFERTLRLALHWRAAVAVAAVFPLAFPMGMLLPIGVQLVARENADLIPWAWATNGCASVLGIFGTRIVAVFVGFSRALALGLAVYLLVAVCVAVHARRRDRSRAATSAGTPST